jgi:hypothetical protein
MNEIDLDRLGDVWRAQPDPAELERLRRAADIIRRRARFAQFTDFGLALAVSGVVLTLMIANPGVKTGVLGGAAILLMLYGSIRQRQFRQHELAILAGNTEDMLDQSIERARATVKRARLGLLGVGPAFLLGIGFSAAIDPGDGVGLIERLTHQPFLSMILATGILVMAVIVSLNLVRVAARARREVERLSKYRDAYRNESAAP